IDEGSPLLSVLDAALDELDHLLVAFAIESVGRSEQHSEHDHQDPAHHEPSSVLSGVDQRGARGCRVVKRAKTSTPPVATSGWRVTVVAWRWHLRWPASPGRR